MKTKTKYFIAPIAAALLAFGCHSKNKNPYCDNSQRYNISGATDWDGDTIGRQEALQWVNAFMDSTSQHRSDKDDVKGVFISKQVLDAIFADKKFNGVFVYFALSDSNEYRMLMEGGTATPIKVGKDLPANAVYRPKTYCPPICGQLIQPEGFGK